MFDYAGATWVWVMILLPLERWDEMRLFRRDPIREMAFTLIDNSLEVRVELCWVVLSWIKPRAGHFQRANHLVLAVLPRVNTFIAVVFELSFHIHVWVECLISASSSDKMWHWRGKGSTRSRRILDPRTLMTCPNVFELWKKQTRSTNMLRDVHITHYTQHPTSRTLCCTCCVHVRYKAICK